MRPLETRSGVWITRLKKTKMIQLAVPLKSMAEGCWVGTRRYAQMDANATHVTTWPGQIL